jgi:NAD(P)H-hydrate repair Nnr-like enzyme with NAD(P)H-hydrate dehydratase domain
MKILFTSTKRNPETLQTTRQTYPKGIQGHALIIGGSYGKIGGEFIL